MPSGAAPAEMSRQPARALGIVLVVVSTIAIAVVPSLARLAYDGGSNTLTVLTFRSVVSVALTWAVAHALGQTLRMSCRALAFSAAAGVCYAVMLVGYLGAVEFIPVNTVILIYFIHPLLIGIVAARLGDEPVTASMMAALTCACVGLGLAVGFSSKDLNAPGVALAALGCVSCVGVIVLNGRAMKSANAMAVVFSMMASASVVLAAGLSFGAWAAPGTPLGWIGLVGVAIGATVGTLTFFAAVAMIGTVRATMISNLEPLLGILFAVLILGEVIGPWQAAGIAMVLASIVFMERARRGGRA